jgi:hypothetical protein
MIITAYIHDAAVRFAKEAAEHEVIRKRLDAFERGQCVMRCTTCSSIMRHNRRADGAERKTTKTSTLGLTRSLRTFIRSWAIRFA